MLWLRVAPGCVAAQESVSLFQPVVFTTAERKKSFGDDT